MIHPGHMTLTPLKHQWPVFSRRHSHSLVVSAIGSKVTLFGNASPSCSYGDGWSEAGRCFRAALSRPLERVWELRASTGGRGHILPPPAISAPRKARNKKHGSGWARIRTLWGANLVTLGQHLQGQMTSTMQNFRTFGTNVQRFALAVLAPKLRQIASIFKKEDAQWTGLF